MHITPLWYFMDRQNLCTGAGPYSDVIMNAMASPLASLTIVYSTVYSGADQINHQNSPHKGPVTQKMFPFDDVIMLSAKTSYHHILRNLHAGRLYFKWSYSYKFDGRLGQTNISLNINLHYSWDELSYASYTMFILLFQRRLIIWNNACIAYKA